MTKGMKLETLDGLLGRNKIPIKEEPLGTKENCSLKSVKDLEGIAA